MWERAGSRVPCHRQSLLCVGATAMAAEGGAAPTDYVRIKRKQTTIFAYLESGDTIHDLRAKVNHVTKVPTTEMKFFIDKDGEVPVDEVKSLADQKVGRAHAHAIGPDPSPCRLIPLTNAASLCFPPHRFRMRT